MGFTVRTLVVLALVGAGFAVGYALTRDEPGTAASSSTTTRAKAVMVSIQTPAAPAPVPALVSVERKPSKPGSAVAGTAATGSTTAAVSAVASDGAARPSIAPARRQTTTSPATTRTETSTGTSTDAFGFHEPTQPKDGSAPVSP